MPAVETLSNTKSRGGLLRKTVVGLSLTVAAASSACAAPDSSTSAPETAPTTVATKSQDRGSEMWSSALLEMREKVANHESVLLLVARDTCIAWPNIVEGAYTVQHNPAMYGHSEGDEQLSFFPFVPSTSDGSNVIMNGPYNYQARIGAPATGNVSAVVLEDHIYKFEAEEHIFEVKQEPNPTPFTAGWLEAEDGTRIAETRVVIGTEIQDAFDGQCEIVIEQPKTSGPV